jgi:hypothetical protein
MNAPTWNINDMAKKELTLTFTINGLREFKIRAWIVLRLIDLIALIAPFSIVVNLKEH